MPQTRILRSLLAGGFLAAIPTPSGAVDGVLEINQTCAVQTGCFTGDAAGFPVAITAPGSYRLTSDLVLPDVDTSGVLVAMNDGDVTLDLNGFAIRCPTCAGPGTGDGVRVPSNLPTLTVRNGTIRNVGHRAISAAGRAQIDGVRAESNGNVGIAAGANSSITDSTAVGNASNGILVGSDSLVTGSVANLNGAHGIYTGNNCRIAANVANANTGDGIQCNSFCNAIGNQTKGNDGIGIHCANRCQVSGNAANQNGQIGVYANHASVTNNTASENGAEGIRSYVGTIVGNAAVFNGSFGLVGDLSSGYASNQFDNNNGGNANPQVSGGREIGPNICGGNTTCP